MEFGWRERPIDAQESKSNRRANKMADAAVDGQVNRGHKTVKSGRGAREKKKAKKDKRDGNQKDRHNVRAFGVANTVRTQRSIQRNLDRAQKKEYVPLSDRRAARVEEGPPPVVAVVGPPGVGKSTLIRSLVRVYTNHGLTDPTGPITVCTSKTRRITLVECPNDAAAMLDVAKIADLVLLCVDAKFGFEMESFEFLNMMQTHGFPKVMGVFTHLDQFRTMKNLRKTKKLLKHRFWTEIYDGAKMFYFGGVVNGKYLKHEVKQLTLLLGRVKYRPLVWRNTHPYVVVDRHEDITHPSKIEEDEKCQRSVAFYGYVRGTNLKAGTKVHLIGVGDFEMADLSPLPDPCPVLDRERESQTLNRKETKLYAPLSNVGNVSFDKDAVYIDIGRANYTKKENLDRRGEDGEGGDGGGDEDSGSSSEDEDAADDARMLKSLQDVRDGVDTKLKYSSLRLFKGSRAVEAGEGEDENGEEEAAMEAAVARVRRPADDAFQLADSFRQRFDGAGADGSDGDGDSSDSESESDDDDDSGSDDDGSDDGASAGDESRDGSESDGSESDDGEEEGGEGGGSWRTDMARAAARDYLRRERSFVNLQQLVYGAPGQSSVVSDDAAGGEDGDDDGGESDSGDESGSDDEFFKLKDGKKRGQSGPTGSGGSSGGASSHRPQPIELGEDDSSRLPPPGGGHGGASGAGGGLPYDMEAWLEEGEGCLVERIRNKFVTGDWGAGDGEDGGEREVFDKFEDLEAGERYGPNGRFDERNFVLVFRRWSILYAPYF